MSKYFQLFFIFSIVFTILAFIPTVLSGGCLDCESTKDCTNNKCGSKEKQFSIVSLLVISTCNNLIISSA